jgi:hypothetical protein
VRIDTGAQLHRLLRLRHTDMDETRHRWNTAPAFVPSTGVGHGADTNFQGEDRRRACLQRRQELNAPSIALAVATPRTDCVRRAGDQKLSAHQCVRPADLTACLRVLARQKVAPRHARQSLKERLPARGCGAACRAFDGLRALRHSGGRPGRKNRRFQPNRKTDL